MRVRNQRSFALTCILTGLAFSGAPAAHFAMVDHGAGESDGALAHVTPCNLGHEDNAVHSSSLTEDCPAGHEADLCHAAALLRSEAWLPSPLPLLINGREAVGTRAPAPASAGHAVYRLAPKASPPGPA